MVNTMYCDVCHHELNVIKNTFKPTNTHSIFSDKYLHLTKKQNIVIDVMMIFFKKFFIINTFNQANTRTMKKGKVPLNSPLKTLMGHSKDI